MAFLAPPAGVRENWGVFRGKMFDSRRRAVAAPIAPAGRSTQWPQGSFAELTRAARHGIVFG